MAITGILLLLVLPSSYFAVFRFVPVPLTSFMVQGTISGWLEKKPYELRHHWLPLAAISPRLQRAVIAGEDQKFTEHFGIDTEAIEKAYVHNQRGKRIRGGSTISQQLAKNLFLWPGRSYLRKGLEAWLTLLMEVLWSKERILEVYLNSIELGRGIYGAEAAAQHYFHKPAARLTSHEAALLVAVLPAPRMRNPARPSADVQLRARWIQGQMARIGPVERSFTED